MPGHLESGGEESFPSACPLTDTAAPQGYLSCLFTLRGPGDRSSQLFLVSGKYEGLHLPPELLSECPESGPPVPHWGALAQEAFAPHHLEDGDRWELCLGDQ